MGTGDRQVVRTLFADGSGRLDAVAGPLAERGFEIDRVADPESLAETDTDGYDLVVVVHDETTTPKRDGVAGVETALAAVDCPVALYAIGFPGAAVAAEAIGAGAADAVYVPPERGELLAHRLRCAATGDDGFDPPEQLLADFFEYFPEGVYVKDDHGRFAVTSCPTVRSQGYNRDQLVGLTDYELLHPDLADALYEQERRIRERGEPQVDVVEHYVEDGQDRWVTSTKVPRYDAEGNVTGIVGGTRDVTQSRRRERLLATLHEGSRDLMRAETRTDVCQMTTELADDIAALPSVQVALYDGSTLRPSKPTGSGGSTFDRYERWFWRSFETGDPQYVTTESNGRTVRTDAADPSAIDAVVLPLGRHGALGMWPDDPLDEFTLELANVLGATVEASLDRAQREQELREREAELERQNQRLEEFATMVSHDLRNPLQIAFGAADMLDAEDKHGERLYAALSQMNRLVDELLTLAREGEIAGERTPVEVASLAETAWNALDTGTATLELDDAGTVLADRDRLRELFENLFWVLLRQADGLTLRVGRLDDGLYIEQAGGDGSTEADPSATRPLDTDDWTQYGRYIVSTIAEAYGWTVTSADTDGRYTRFEIRGMTVQ
ncbi:PAS domain-containing sensor histidine kinase [Haloarcula nitratireducens]|uniref:histidine kinase n=1 Tax=Haloarcula nitratireducens TaxID=2487749 RepID=A0AAW4PDF2_9EURY|nr:PAS domain-containing sensor histidine kinase [Halomicroarcula nitratireducens]MBX0295949.1 PAS domain-containing sensor histidine kinase [Halomicroarcula nitratireducens]